MDQVNADGLVIDYWTFGGGTAMMLQIDHRDSHDVDIFFRRPEFLQFLYPEIREFEFEIVPAAYDGDGSRFRKFAFEGIGEIDFIAASELTETPTIQKMVEGRKVQLETVPEIITKKIFHRGSSIRPRDIFDIAAACRTFEANVVASLRRYPKESKVALETLKNYNPEFVANAINALMIKEEFEDIISSSLDDTKRILSSASS
jgi:hypothetical protein